MEILHLFNKLRINAKKLGGNSLSNFTRILLMEAIYST